MVVVHFKPCILSDLSILWRLPAVSTPHTETSISTSTKVPEAAEDEKNLRYYWKDSTFPTHLSDART